MRYPDEITVGCSHCVDLEIVRLVNLSCQLSNEPLASFVDGLAVSLIRQAYFPRLRVSNMDISRDARLPECGFENRLAGSSWGLLRRSQHGRITIRHDDGVLNQGVPLRTVLRPAS